MHQITVNAAPTSHPQDSMTIPTHSSEPFGRALRALMLDRSLTYRGLADATRARDGKGITHAHINMLAHGRDRPSVRAMELIADACDIDAEYFAEYRLAKAMRQLDPAAVGLERALENLETLRR